MKNQFVLPWVIIVVIVIVLEVIGSSFALMSHSSLGYDKLLHFLAGNACGIFGVWLLRETPLCNRFPEIRIFSLSVWFFAIGSALTIGILWEIAQAYFPFMRDASDYDWYDTVGDIIFDMLGGIVAGLMYQEKT